MWYGSNSAWGARKEDMRHLIKYAESTDGIDWTRNNIIAIDFLLLPTTFDIARTSVLNAARAVLSRADWWLYKYVILNLPPDRT
jgi:hypothetical protein